MTPVVKQARVRHTSAPADASGWIPPNAPMQHTLEGTVDLVVQIVRADAGFRLQWIGAESEFSGEHWYAELPYAEHAAEELFGISSTHWERPPREC